MPMNRNFRPLPALALALLVRALPAPAADSASPSPQSAPTPIMSRDQVRVGMTGYGRAGFRGAAIEPFAVEVVSVMHGFAPQRAVIWIRCPDERMQKSGAVSGMSGSPIYLWDEHEPPVPGQGGRLIGAFAYGFQTGKDCYAGVQPIEAMRLAGARTSHISPRAVSGGSAQSLAKLRNLLAVASRQPRTPASTWRLAALLKALGGAAPAGTVARFEPPTVPLPFSAAGRVGPLALPLAVPSAAGAELLEPLLAGTGIRAVSTGSIAGPAPAGIDVDAIRLEPGAVLGVPLLWGDLDLAFSGTVTDVLPDGQVLGFGHALLGQGPVSLPMSNGYVHYVFPSIVQSFKLAGSGLIRGTLVGDEQFCVVGMPQQTFETAKLTVHVHQPGQPDRTYHYQAARHPQLTPSMAAIAALESLTAAQDLPFENSLDARARLKVDGVRELELAAFLPQASAMDAALLLLPSLQMLAENDFESLLLREVECDLAVHPKTEQLTIVEAAVSRLQVEPGETVEVALRLQPHGLAPCEKRLPFEIPAHLPDGDYDLVVSGVEAYMQHLMSVKPHLFKSQRIDELLRVLQLIGSADERSYYLTMELPEQMGVAVGRQEMGRLPSSRHALFTRPGTSGASGFSALLEKRVPCAQAVQGQAVFTLHVRREIKSPATGE